MPAYIREVFSKLLDLGPEYRRGGLNRHRLEIDLYKDGTYHLDGCARHRRLTFDELKRLRDALSTEISYIENEPYEENSGTYATITLRFSGSEYQALSETASMANSPVCGWARDQLLKVATDERAKVREKVLSASKKAAASAQQSIDEIAEKYNVRSKSSDLSAD